MEQKRRGRPPGLKKEIKMELNSAGFGSVANFLIK